MTLRALVEYDPEVGSFAVYCPELPGCASAGDTEEEALTNIREAIALYLEPSPIDVTLHGKVFEVEVPA
ncbi:MAG: type II toxin-antitoxin system HicB family antitoxin [SAR202 cluster bacterium]|jgi:predicted RNase H-like HicB family nuclease|nr:type II toxin-antitoxin system HicB family antitoxin [SAR202 cluster bacterium]MDP7105076.1 type II toxin-antitoxin system HicB family antitoxin [SAR202 cluster bacterium]MDP7414930.1 type II toxin-antitoxin system HicB family antitoxin [SAR202 cluster bacterium]MDP7533664.1 type II toxin-antitoxin system HicB family antitoxin [SAR202 cluster bacterium]